VVSVSSSTILWCFKEHVAFVNVCELGRRSSKRAQPDWRNLAGSLHFLPISSSSFVMVSRSLSVDCTTADSFQVIGALRFFLPVGSQHRHPDSFRRVLGNTDGGIRREKKSASFVKQQTQPGHVLKCSNSSETFSSRLHQYPRCSI
jgi:hypothetical protein